MGDVYQNITTKDALEYTQYVFQASLHSYGTIHQLICLGTSEQNGRAERKLRHILDIVHAFLLLFGAKLLFMLFMLLIAFPVLSFKIKLHINDSLGHL